jgi:hypothetical protein
MTDGVWGNLLLMAAMQIAPLGSRSDLIHLIDHLFGYFDLFATSIMSTKSIPSTVSIARGNCDI